jgi:hypothetical protein
VRKPSGVSFLETNLLVIRRLLYGMSLGSIALCITLWIRAKTIGEDERGNAERRALFVGLWPPMFWLMGDTVAREHARLDSAGKTGRLRPRWRARVGV